MLAFGIFPCLFYLTNGERFWGCSDSLQTLCVKVQIEKPDEMRLEMLVRQGAARSSLLLYPKIRFSRTSHGRFKLVKKMDTLGFHLDFSRDEVTPSDSLDDVADISSLETEVTSSIGKNCFHLLGIVVCPQRSTPSWRDLVPELRLETSRRTNSLFVRWFEGGLLAEDLIIPSRFHGCWSDDSGCMSIAIESDSQMRIEMMIGVAGNYSFVALPAVNFVLKNNVVVMDDASATSDENIMHSFDTGATTYLDGNLKNVLNYLKPKEDFPAFSSHIFGGCLFQDKIDLRGIHLRLGEVNWIHLARFFGFTQGWSLGEETEAFLLRYKAGKIPKLADSAALSRQWAIVPIFLSLFALI